MPLPSCNVPVADSDSLPDRYSWGACLAAHAAAQLEDITAFVGVSPVTGRECVFCKTCTLLYMH